METRRTWTRACAAAIMALLVAAAPAAAERIAYNGSDGNVWLTDAAGSRHHQVTRDGASQIYTATAQTDDGAIVVGSNSHWLHILNEDGSNRRGPFLAPTDNGMSTSPISVDIQPTGGLITYWHLFDDDITQNPPVRPRVAFASSDIPTSAQCTPTQCIDYYDSPRWIPGGNVVAAVGSSGAELRVQSGGSMAPWLGLDPAVATFKTFDISRTGYRVLMNNKDEQNGDYELIVWDNKVAPPDASKGTAVCGLDNFGGSSESHPRWSPDGTRIAWSDAQGVWVSPAPVSDGSTENNCVLAPKLVAPGGKFPDWSAANLPASPSTTTGGGTTGGGTTGGGTTGGGTTDGGTTDGGTADTAAPRAALKKARQRLRTVLKRGFKAVVTTDEAAVARLRITVSGRDARRLRVVAAKTVTVAKGSKRLTKPGRASVVAKFTRKAKKRFGRARKLKMKLVLTVTDAAGNRTVKRSSVALKR